MIHMGKNDNNLIYNSITECKYKKSALFLKKKRESKSNEYFHKNRYSQIFIRTFDKKIHINEQLEKQAKRIHECMIV